MTRALSLLMLLGAGLALVTILIPSAGEDFDDRAYVAISVAALLGAVILRAFGSRMPLLAFQALTAFGTVLITLSIYYAGSESGGASENELFYLWPILLSSYFFSRRAAAVQLGVLAASYTVLLMMLDPSGGGVARWMGTVATLTAAGLFVRYLRERLDRDLSLQQATIESTTDGILVVDGNGRWVTSNRKFLEIWRVPAEIVRSRDDDAALEFVLDQLAEPGTFIAKVRELYDTPEAESSDELVFKDGRVLERYSQPQRVEGRSVGRVWSFRDVTERRQFEQRLQYLAEHDPLTDLYNRRRFEEELDREVERSVRYGTGGALLLLDIDNFKAVNDHYGHVWGDELLRAVARVLGSRVRGTDVLARLGGDEFAILLPEADEVHAGKLAEELLEVLRAQSMETERGAIQVTTSLGVVTLDTVRTAGPEPMVAADTAMYRAKAEGRNRLAVYEASRDRSGPGRVPRARSQPAN
jgi:diguanylate cyclase (GGDEF)-like protein/PAS domain S-box-containing protein